MIPTMRCILATVAGGATGYALAGLLFLTIRDVGIGIAIAAGCVVLLGLIRYIQRSSRRAMRAQRNAVWERRIAEAGGIRGGKDPDWLFKAPYWALPSDPFDERTHR